MGNGGDFKSCGALSLQQYKEKERKIEKITTTFVLAQTLRPVSSPRLWAREIETFHFIPSGLLAIAIFLSSTDFYFISLLVVRQPELWGVRWHTSFNNSKLRFTRYISAA